ncbi:hypothetical protein HELRODRAFT_62760, partial [Helobdella robusta]|uniref:Uncharacterized protein n=1 Tax=Helobdella robusta TaxID=6412 RepID=T1FX46_HELRO
VFGRAIHSLAKIGEEIYFGAETDGLAVKSVNSSRTGFASFFFKSSFFLKYSKHSTSSTNDLSASTSCLMVFKSLSNLEKTVDKCKISLNVDEDRLMFQLQCRHGLVKTYNLTYFECENLQALFNTNDNQNSICTQSKLFAEVVSNFQPSVDELNITMLIDRVLIRNHVEDINGGGVVWGKMVMRLFECKRWRGYMGIISG